MLKKRIIGSLLIITAFSAVFVATMNKFMGASFYNVTKAHLDHSGNHYVEKLPGPTTPGHKEFWVCCECHQVFLEKPSSGTWTTQDDTYMIGGLNPTHPAYLNPTVSGGSNGDYWYKDPFED